MRILIIGGDAAGMSAASRARRRLKEAEITVFEQTRDVSYSACGMPYNIAEPERSLDDLVVRQAKVFQEKLGLDLRLGHKAVEIFPQEQKVLFLDEQGKEDKIGYDKLVIATGARAAVPDLPAGMDLPGIEVLKTLDQGRRLKANLKDRGVKRVVVVGMGYIALEMAEALRARDLEVCMVKPRPRLLPWFPKELSDMVRQELEKNKVELFPGQEILGIEKQDEKLVLNCHGLGLSGEMVLVSIGVRPNSELASRAGLSLSVQDSISVDRSQLTSDENIYSAGDCADSYHVVTNEKTWIPLALRANRGGWAVADHLSGAEVKVPGVAGTAVFKVFDLEVARTGLNLEEAQNSGFDPAEILIESRSRAHAHRGSGKIKVNMVGDKKSGRLLGMQMVGEEGVAHRINAGAVALHNQMSVEEFSKTDLAYAPPFGPIWDPMLTAANQLLKKM